jgi:glyoxylase-like metal-dependent hydrolase (beta-lactamase superfamily II)
MRELDRANARWHANRPQIIHTESMIRVETIKTPGLGDHSYLATDGDVAVVVDPQRDIDRVLAMLDDLGVRLTYVL